MKVYSPACLKIMKIVAGIFILFFVINNVCAQNDPTVRVIPRMWENKRIEKEKKRWFKHGIYKDGVDTKYNILIKNNGSETQSFVFQKEVFQKLLDSVCKLKPPFLRIYFASYDERYGPVPYGLDKHLTLLFCPAASDGNDIGENYFNVTPDGTIMRINTTTKASWIDYYVKNQLYSLKQTIDEVTDNRDNHGEYSDTKSLLYPIGNIIELTEEIGYQKLQNNKNITGIEIDLASYTNQGLSIYGTLHYKNRLYIQFQFTKQSWLTRKRRFFYIDNTRGFRRRPKPQPLEHIFFDNGQLCPPASGCPNP